jgi:hypothetical protein
MYFSINADFVQKATTQVIDQLAEHE